MANPAGESDGEVLRLDFGRVIAKVEWHPGELYPRVGFIVTNMSRPPENVVAFYNKRGTCEQWMKEGKGAIKWTRLSCRSFAANAVRLQLHALAYKLGNFLRALATPEPIKDWSLTSLKEKLIKIGAKVISHGRYVAFQMADCRHSENSLRRHPAHDRRIAAAIGHIDSVRRSLCHAFHQKPRERCVLMTATAEFRALDGVGSVPRHRSKAAGLSDRPNGGMIKARSAVYLGNVSQVTYGFF
jgi:Transposase DDE domain group 1